jgi:hypothetical protein
MAKLVVGLLALLVGIGIGFFGSARLAGTAAGVGAGAGLVTGICAIIESGKAAGVLTDDEVGTILARVAADFGASVPEGTDMSALDCSAVKPGAPGG